MHHRSIRLGRAPSRYPDRPAISRSLDRGPPSRRSVQPRPWPLASLGRIFTVNVSVSTASASDRACEGVNFPRGARCCTREVFEGGQGRNRIESVLTGC